MDEKKKSEASGDTSLLREHAAEERATSGKSGRVLLEFCASLGYSALRVKHTDWARAQDRQSAESLLLTLESVLKEVQRMLRAVSGPPEPRLRWRLGLGVASAVTVCALLFALVYWAPVSQPPSAPPAPMSHEELTAGENPDTPTYRGVPDTADAGPSVIARPLPKEPFKGQKRPPCHRYAEVELIGACWMPHKLKAPCPDVLYEHQGECYSPTLAAKPPPSSLEQ
jgi:hypothetical protein